MSYVKSYTPRVALKYDKPKTEGLRHERVLPFDTRVENKGGVRQIPEGYLTYFIRYVKVSPAHTPISRASLLAEILGVRIARRRRADTGDGVID